MRPVLSIAAWHCGGFSQLRSCANQQRQPQPTNVAAELQRLRRLPQTAHRQCGRTVFSASVLLTGVRHCRRKEGFACVVPSQSIQRRSQLLPRLRQHSRTAWRTRMGSWEQRMAWPDGRRYMGTIGMAEIDYFVSDPQHIPPAYVELSAAMRDACLSHLVPPCMRPKYCPVPCTLTPHRCATMCHSKAWQSTPCCATAPEYATAPPSAQ